MRRALALAVLLGLMAGCGLSTGTDNRRDTGSNTGSKSGDETTTNTGNDDDPDNPGADPEPGDEPGGGEPGPTKTAGTKPGKPGKPVSCSTLGDALVLGSEPPYGDHPDGMQLSGGMWSSSDGERLAKQEPCATGTVDGLGTTTVGSFMFNIDGTTGRYWAITLCAKDGSATECIVQKVLDDREPIEAIDIAGGEVSVVSLTRPEDGPMAGLDTKRTTAYRYHVDGLMEINYVDEPYNP